MRACGCVRAAEKLVELHPDFFANPEAAAEAVAKWTPLYLPSRSFDLTRRVDYKVEPEDSSTYLDCGTFTVWHRDNARPETHVVGIARYSIDGSTGPESDDAGTYEHYANTLDAAAIIRKKSMPDLEPRWAAVVEAFTIIVDEMDRVWFVFFAVRCTPLTEHPAYVNPGSDPAELQRLMWHLAVSAWFVENVAGLAHRDIKPANVLVTRHGAVLSDFGSARPMGCRGNPAYYLNPPWMDTDELASILNREKHVWAKESSSFAIGMIMLRGVWGNGRFSRMFPQQRQPRWPRAIAKAREHFFEKKYRKCIDKSKSGLETAALLLASPSKTNRRSLEYTERVLRPASVPMTTLLVHLPAPLQRTVDVPV